MDREVRVRPDSTRDWHPRLGVIKTQPIMRVVEVLEPLMVRRQREKPRMQRQPLTAMNRHFPEPVRGIPIAIADLLQRLLKDLVDAGLCGLEALLFEQIH
ncbi:MAG: hypothetical protein AAGI24_04260 [Pseudomonadota bacterium]